MYNGGKYNLVSGSKRSGTSLMMLALRQSGIPIVGFRYGIYLNEFTYSGNKLDIGLTLPSDEMKRANPNGVWEIPSIVAKTGITDYYKDIGIKGDAMKICSDFIIFSEPHLIDKTIMMMRDPKAVLSSMIRCNMFQREDASKVSLLIAKEITTAIQFLKENNKEFKVVSYEGFLKEPHYTMEDVCAFLGRGDYKYGADVVDRKLNHGEIEDLGDISELEKVCKSALKL